MIMKVKNARLLRHPAPMARHLDPTRRQDLNVYSRKLVGPVNVRGPKAPMNKAAPRNDTLTVSRRKVGPVVNAPKTPVRRATPVRGNPILRGRHFNKR